MERTLKQLVIQKILETANANTLNRILNSPHYASHLSVNNYMRLETARRLRRMTNNQIHQELIFLNNRQAHTRPNNRNAMGIILRRRAELYGEQMRRAGPI